jgi:hypothetical protein
LPDIPIERSEFFLHCQKGLRIGHRRLDLQPIADDAGIIQEPHFPGGCELSYLGRIKPGKGLPIAFPSSKDCVPAEAGLRAFEQQHFKKPPIVMHRPPPLPVVIPNHMGFVPSPETSRLRYLFKRHDPTLVPADGF